MSDVLTARRPDADAIGRISSVSIVPIEPNPDPIEIDPRPCQLCGLTIDQHIMVDDGEGPLFFCEEFEPDAANIIKRWEMDDPRDRWKWTGEAPPPANVRNSDISAKPVKPPKYATPEATINAFWFVVRLADPERLAAWLDDHPKDEFFLLKVLERK
jgi:hypothetical protein